MKTRAHFAIKMPDRSKDSMLDAIYTLTKELPQGAFKKFTSDRGKEFACYEDIESELNINFYFDDPYSAWKRETNENSNGLLREFFPKKTDLAKIEEEDLKHISSKEFFDEVNRALKENPDIYVKDEKKEKNIQQKARSHS